MADLVRNFLKFYQWTVDVGDPRTEDWFLSSHRHVITICVLYLLGVWLGPRLMASRPAFSLKPAIVIYNLASVVISIYMLYEYIATAVLSNYSLACEPIDESMDPLSIRMASVTWVYYMAKISEVLDTTFFILRKKGNQVTFLHVYHHFTMIINGFMGVKYVPGGNNTYWSALNCFVHIFMYTYYGLSAIGPHMQKYLTWKRYLTQLQLTQMFMFLAHTTYIMFVADDCGYPLGFTIWMNVYAITLAALFLNFYIRSYVSKSKPPKKEN